jgi:hypothetical protein
MTVPEKGEVREIYNMSDNEEPRDPYRLHDNGNTVKYASIFDWTCS